MDLIYRVNSQIDPSIFEWLAYSSTVSSPRHHIDRFLGHLQAIRQAVMDNCDEAIILEEDVQLAEDFEDRVNELLYELEEDFDILLLAVCVSNWEGLQFEDEYRVCTINENVHGSFAYLISRHWMERCLSFYDRPFRTIPETDLTPELITRGTPFVRMLEQPLVYKTTTEEDREYFRHYFPEI